MLNRDEESVLFDNTFHRQLADVRNSQINQNHPDVELLVRERQKEARSKRLKTMLDSLTGIPALDPETLTQPQQQPQPEPLPEEKKERIESSSLNSFADTVDAIQLATAADRLTLCVFEFPELLKLRISMGDEALKVLKAYLAIRIVEELKHNSYFVGDYRDNRLIVLLPALTNSNAHALLQRVVDILSEEHANYKHARIRTNCHIGIATSEPGQAWQDLLSKADLAVGTNGKKNRGNQGFLSWFQRFFVR